MDIQATKAYQDTSRDEMFRRLDSAPDGLSDAEARERSRVFGFNELAKKKKLSPILRFLSYFKDPLSIVLIVAAVVSTLTGEVKSFFIIILMVILSVVLNFYQEHKSSRAAEAIAKKLTVRAAVLRDGARKEILTRYVVPGDVVLLAAGDIVPADGKLIEADDFFVNESVLTGESFPVEKTAVGPGEQSLVFSGTNVVSGSARLLVISTGTSTEYGRVADRLTAPEEINAFEVGIKNFGLLIIKVIVGIVLVIFLINALHRRDLIQSLVFSVAVAVGIAPELLPMILSVNMAKGSIRMAKRGVIVKRLNAIPDFGSMDILCTDKTGTLTEDRITLVRHLDVFGSDSGEVLRLAYINGYFETGIKSLLDQAILDFKTVEVRGIKKIDEIPYDFARKRSSVVFEKGRERRMVTKGAPEEIFKICGRFLDGGVDRPNTAEAEKRFQALYENLSAQGFRVLAVATKETDNQRQVYKKEEEDEMTLVGFVAFYDPPKQSAKETLEFMKQHGIEVKILTGDSALVTRKICQELDIEIKGVVTGDQIDVNTMSEEVIAVKATGANILARMSPSQKEKIISALKSKGYVVGYLGDGINDAPSLKNADVGISVENAVDVAKETADIILVKKGLKELMDGVLEGRKAFGNTMKYMMMGLSSNFGNMFSMIGAVLYLPFFPMTAGQILLNNFLYDVSQVSIPMDKVDEEYLKKPKHWDIKFIRNFMFIFGPISSIFDFLTFYLLYSVFGLAGAAFQTGWFIESLATQTFVIYIIRTRRLPFFQSRPSRYLVYSTIGIFALALLIVYTSVGRVFDFVPPSAKILAAIFGLVAVYAVLVELVKQIFYRKIYPKGQN